MDGFSVLASGSKGNCIYVRAGGLQFLIDLGISYKRLEEELACLGSSPRDLSAIFITHEHHDHICGLEALLKRHLIPIYANRETARAVASTIPFRLKFKIFSTGEPFIFDDLTVYPFSIPHDTVDPVAFTFHWKEIQLGICTDLGFVTSQVVARLRHCTHLIVESNHEIDLVYASARPRVYKERVLSKQGHLSNRDCRSLLETICHEKLSSVFLAHLSSECNNPTLALQSVAHIPLSIQLALQDQASAFTPFFNSTLIS